LGLTGGSTDSLSAKEGAFYICCGFQISR
jgi:hypothetical protein